MQRAPPERRLRAEVRVVVALGLVFAFAARFASYSLHADDAFISFRYAENLATLGELVYNAGERVEGFSNLSYTLILAAAASLGVAPPTAATAIGVGAGALTVLGVAHGAHHHLGASPTVAASMGLALALSPSFAFWAGGGLETPLFALLLLLAWLTADAAAGGGLRTAALFGLLGGTLALTRPEGHALVPLVGALLWARGGSRRQIASALAVATALPLAALGWRAAYYGAWVPNPVLAKLAFNGASLARGAAYVWEGVRDDALYLLLPAVLFGDLRSARHRTVLVGAGLGGALAIVAGGDGLYRARLLAPWVPLLLLAATSGTERLWSRSGRWRAVALAGPLATAIVPLASTRFFRDHTLADVREWEERWSAVGAALAPHRTPEALLATNVAGRVPYRSRWRTLDLLGLTDRVIATTPAVAAGGGYAGHERAAPGYVLSRMPDVIYLSVLDGLPAAAVSDPRVVEAVVARGSLYRYAPLFGSAELWDHYAPARLPLSDGTAANLLVRRDGSLRALAGAE